MNKQTYQEPTFELVDVNSETAVAAAGPVVIIIACGLLVTLTGCTAG